jgi:NAD(P)-dependent dehydrogenase (short-subunit alcohol dehydrogenase family)
MRSSSLLKRFAKPDEVAAVIAFACSPLSSLALGADGGPAQEYTLLDYLHEVEHVVQQ